MTKQDCILMYFAGTVMGIVLSACAALAFDWVRKPDTVDVRVETDTIHTVKVDTVFIDRPNIKYVRTVDTVYMKDPSDSFRTVALPVEQKLYSNEGLYDIWISGIEASIDSLRFYNRTTETVVSERITNVVLKRTWDFYINTGFKHVSPGNIYNIGLTAKTPKRWLIGAEIGLFDNRSLYYGFNLGYKLNR